MKRLGRNQPPRLLNTCMIIPKLEEVQSLTPNEVPEKSGTSALEEGKSQTVVDIEGTELYFSPGFNPLSLRGHDHGNLNLESALYAGTNEKHRE